MTKTAEKPHPLIGAAHTYIAHIREYPSEIPEKKLRVRTEQTFPLHPSTALLKRSSIPEEQSKRPKQTLLNVMVTIQLKWVFRWTNVSRVVGQKPRYILRGTTTRTLDSHF